MNLFYSDVFVLPLPSHHRFPMGKYARLRDRLLGSGEFGSDDLGVPPGVTDGEITRVHCPDYLRRVSCGALSPAEQKAIGFPWSERMVERSRRSSGATLAAAREALTRGWGANLAGGTHHAYADHGEGYCVFNDSAVAARAMQAEGRAGRVVIIDCDVHQGNGTAAILAGDDTIFTFSIHGAKNFPFHKERSDLDIALDDGAGDAEYLAALDHGLCQAIELSRADLAIYLAGADPFVDDKLGRLAISKRGLAERDQMVFMYCRQAGLPVAITMAGGYARAIEDTVDIHFQTLRGAADMI